MGFALILVIIGWLYVALLMALAEAMSPVGSWLGAVFTFVLYGVLPLSILVYVLESRSEEHTSELQSLSSISYAVFCLKKKK